MLKVSPFVLTLLRLPVVGKLQPIPVLVAHGIAISLVSHSQYLFFTPTRLEWILLELFLSTLCWLAGRSLIAQLAEKVRAISATGLTIVIGLGLATWWHGKLTDTLWIFDESIRSVTQIGLFLAHGIVFTTLCSLLFVLLASTDPQESPVPGYKPLATGKQEWLLVGAFGIAAVAFSTWYVKQEQTIYLADSMYYWTQSADWTEQVLRSPSLGWKEFRESIHAGGYTLVPAIFPALAMSLLGEFRTIYVGSVALFYLTGTLAALLWILRKSGATFSTALFGTILLFTTPLAWIPVLLGYPDVGGVALALVSLWLIAGRSRESLRWQHLFGTAAVLVAMILFRRWYMCWAVGLIAMTTLDSCIAACRPMLNWQVKETWRALRPGILLASLFAIVLATVSWTSLPGLNGTNYTQILTAYRSPDSLLVRISRNSMDIGLAYILMSAVSTIYLLSRSDTRRISAYLMGITFVTLGLFYRLQDPNTHHLYLVLPWILLPPAMACGGLLSRMPSGISFPVIGSMTVIGAGNMLGTFTTEWKATRDRFAPLATGLYNPPNIRNDRPGFERILDFVTAETSRTGKRFLVLPSSPNMHFSMFQSISRSYNLSFPAAKFQLPTAEVDRVLGFPDTLFQADLIVAAEPLQIHLRPEEQQTVILPYQLLKEGKGIGKAFERLDQQFEIQNGVKIGFFRRIRPIAEEDFQSFCEQLRQAHPLSPYVFTPRFPASELTKMPE